QRIRICERIGKYHMSRRRFRIDQNRSSQLSLGAYHISPPQQNVSQNDSRIIEVGMATDYASERNDYFIDVVSGIEFGFGKKRLRFKIRRSYRQRRFETLNGGLFTTERLLGATFVDECVCIYSAVRFNCPGKLIRRSVELLLVETIHTFKKQIFCFF